MKRYEMVIRANIYADSDSDASIMAGIHIAELEDSTGISNPELVELNHVPFGSLTVTNIYKKGN